MEHDIIVITSDREVEDTGNLSIIQRYLRSAKGRASLAQSMIAPIRRSLDYHAISRKTFLVQQLPMPGDPNGTP